MRRRRTRVQLPIPLQGPNGPFFMFTVYVLYSSSAGKHYTGFTSDLVNRLHSHNEMGKEWTARYRPWTLIYMKEFDTKLEAMRYEQWLKSGQGRAFIKTLPHG